MSTFTNEQGIKGVSRFISRKLDEQKGLIGRSYLIETVGILSKFGLTKSSCEGIINLFYDCQEKTYVKMAITMSIAIRAMAFYKKNCNVMLDVFRKHLMNPKPKVNISGLWLGFFETLAMLNKRDDRRIEPPTICHHFAELLADVIFSGKNESVESDKFFNSYDNDYESRLSQAIKYWVQDCDNLAFHRHTEVSRILGATETLYQSGVVPYSVLELVLEQISFKYFSTLNQTERICALNLFLSHRPVFQR